MAIPTQAWYHHPLSVNLCERSVTIMKFSSTGSDDQLMYSDGISKRMVVEWHLETLKSLDATCGLWKHTHVKVSWTCTKCWYACVCWYCFMLEHFIKSRHLIYSLCSCGVLVISYPWQFMLTRIHKKLKHTHTHTQIPSYTHKTLILTCRYNTKLVHAHCV